MLNMIFTQTALEGVYIVEPHLWVDGRGHFFESFSLGEMRKLVENIDFVQDNESLSRYGVVRGLHYQLPPASQGKLVRVVKGIIRDVAVDIRKGSPTFGHYVAVELSGENKKQLFVPRGFAHGFSVLSAEAQVVYKCDSPYSHENEASIAFDDAELGIDWGIPTENMVVSDKDRQSPSFAQARLFDYKDKLY